MHEAAPFFSPTDCALYRFILPQHMKTSRLFSFFAFLIACSGLSAQGIQLQLRGSYGFPTSESVLETVSFTDSLGNTTQEANIVSLGGGVTFGIDAAYMFNDHFGAQIGFQYLAGRRTRALVQQQPGFLNINSEVYTRQGQLTIGGIVSSGGDPIEVFSRFGLLLPVVGITTIEVDFEFPFAGSHEFTKAEVDGKFALGFYGGLGGRYKLSDRIGLSLEAVFSSLRIKANQSILVEKTNLLTGESVLEDQPGAVVTTNYQTELNENSNNPDFNADFDNTMPRDELSYASNYSNLGIQLGISFFFGN